MSDTTNEELRIGEVPIEYRVVIYDALEARGKIDVRAYTHYCRMLTQGRTLDQVVECIDIEMPLPLLPRPIEP
jgi:hypothetical protein